MNLSKRLKEIASLVEEKSKIIDVGCDHALLDIYLEKEKQPLKIVASDINEKPLEKAKENLKKYNSKIIKLSLSNGIDNIDKDIDTIILSGLGTTTITDILFKNKENLKNIKTIIISTNNDYFLLRKTMQQNNYIIKDEKIVFEKNKFYPIIKYEKGKSNYNNLELEYGPILLKEKEETFKKYLDEETKKLTNIYNKLPNKYLIKKIKLKRKISVLKNI